MTRSRSTTKIVLYGVICLALGTAAADDAAAQTPVSRTIVQDSGPPPDAEMPPDTLSVTDGFTVHPGDLLRIRVWPDSSLGGEFPIEETGFVYLPVLGRIQAGGRSLESLREQLRAAYREAMKIPVVTVTSVFRVGVLGAVGRPGLYTVDPSHTLFDVISLAGGFRDDAEPDELRIVRSGEVIEIDAERALETGEEVDVVGLRSGDRVVVPEQNDWFSFRDVQFLIQMSLSVITLLRVLDR